MKTKLAIDITLPASPLQRGWDSATLPALVRDICTPGVTTHALF